MPARILLAEDDVTQAELLRQCLARDGHEALVVHDGLAAVERARRCAPDLLLLDLVLPSLGGLAVCRAVRSEQDIPIIVVSARASEADVLAGLAAGADDYLVKPYRPRELRARVRAVLRRATGGAGVRHDGLVVDTARHEVWLHGVPVPTTPAEFTILACLSGAPGRVFTREQLLARIGVVGREVTSRTIDTHVLNLRRKLEPAPGRHRYLRTVYGVGYKLVDSRRLVPG